MAVYQDIKYDTAIKWQSSIKTGDFTAVSGEGYFVDTTSAVIILTLPASPSVGDFVGIIDYARTFGTNKCVISPNGSNIEGDTSDLKLGTNGASATLVYADATKGWSYTQQSDVPELPSALFVVASGGTETTCGDYKIHTFTSSGTFTVTSAGNACGSNSVDYMVVAGGGGGGGGNGTPSPTGGGGGGGAGGFRESVPSPAAWTASPLANPGNSIPVSVTAYPVTVGGGGSGSPGPSGGPQGSNGSNSVFSTITSAGGGGGRHGSACGNAPVNFGRPGGSGGGAAVSTPAGSGNTPPVSPPQGNPGATTPGGPAGGGGGATASGSTNPPTGYGGPGGAGATTSISGTPTAYAGGGGGGTAGGPSPGRSNGGAGGGGRGGSGSPTVCGSVGGTNTGGGGGGAGSEGPTGGNGASGGSGIVVIRYKFQ